VRGCAWDSAGRERRSRPPAREGACEGRLETPGLERARIEKVELEKAGLEMAGLETVGLRPWA